MLERIVPANSEIGASYAHLERRAGHKNSWRYRRAEGVVSNFRWNIGKIIAAAAVLGAAAYYANSRDPDPTLQTEMVKSQVKNESPSTLNDYASR